MVYGPLDRGSLTLGESPAVLDGPMGVRLCCWLVCLSLLYDLDLVLPCFHGSVNDVSLVLCFVILEFGFVFSAFSIAPPLCSIVCLCYFFYCSLYLSVAALRFFFCFGCGVGSVFMGWSMGRASFSVCLSMFLACSFFYCSLCPSWLPAGVLSLPIVLAMPWYVFIVLSMMLAPFCMCGLLW